MKKFLLSLATAFSFVLFLGSCTNEEDELPAALMTDAIVRLLPGVLGDAESALSDTFQDDLLAPPIYTRPAEFRGWRVPDILLSGHEAKINAWRESQALERTKRLRPDLLEKYNKKP